MSATEPYDEAELVDLRRKNGQTKNGPPADDTIRRENKRLSRWLATIDALKADVVKAKEALREIELTSLAHHADEGKMTLLHALQVEIPTLAETARRALASRSEGA